MGGGKYIMGDLVFGPPMSIFWGSIYCMQTSQPYNVVVVRQRLIWSEIGYFGVRYCIMIATLALKCSFVVTSYVDFFFPKKLHQQ